MNEMTSRLCSRMDRNHQKGLISEDQYQEHLSLRNGTDIEIDPGLTKEMAIEIDGVISSFPADTPIADHFRQQVEAMSKEIPESLDQLIKKLQTPEN